MTAHAMLSVLQVLSLRQGLYGHDQLGGIQGLFPASDVLEEHVLSDHLELGSAVEMLDLSPGAIGSELTSTP